MNMSIYKKLKITYNVLMLATIVFLCSASMPMLAKDALPVSDPTSITAKTINDLAKADPMNSVSYLALFACISSLGLSGYLVKRMMDDAKQTNKDFIDAQKEATLAQNRLAESIRIQTEKLEIANRERIESLEDKQEYLLRKPCAFESQQFADYLNARLHKKV